MFKLISTTSLRLSAKPTHLLGGADLGLTNKLLLNLSSTRESICVNKPIESITVPGAEGTFTITNNHSLIVSMLKPGLLTVREGNNVVKDYFVSDGFVVFNHPIDDSGCCKVEVSGIEVVPTTAIDKEKAAQKITDLSAMAKDSDWDRVKAQLGTGLCNQMLKHATA